MVKGRVCICSDAPVLCPMHCSDRLAVRLPGLGLMRTLREIIFSVRPLLFRWFGLVKPEIVTFFFLFLLPLT